MRPYILNYSESFPIEASPYRYDTAQQINHPFNKHSTDSTLLTFTVESDDRDELQTVSTIETRTLEAADDDEVFFGSTLITKTFEAVDDDEICIIENYAREMKNCSTLITETIEPIDPDEMYV